MLEKVRLLRQRAKSGNHPEAKVPEEFKILWRGSAEPAVPAFEGLGSGVIIDAAKGAMY